VRIHDLLLSAGFIFVLHLRANQATAAAAIAEKKKEKIKKERE
jgi:hypothetical protein